MKGRPILTNQTSGVPESDKHLYGFAVLVSFVQLSSRSPRLSPENAVERGVTKWITFHALDSEK